MSQDSFTGQMSRMVFINGMCVSYCLSALGKIHNSSKT